MENKKFTTIQDIDQLFNNIPASHDKKSFKEWGLKKINRSDIKKYFHIRLSNYDWKQHSNKEKEKSKKTVTIPQTHHTVSKKITPKKKKVKSPQKEKKEIKEYRYKVKGLPAMTRNIPIHNLKFEENQILFNGYINENKKCRAYFDSIKQEINRVYSIQLNHRLKTFRFVYSAEEKELYLSLNKLYTSSSISKTSRKKIPWKHIVFGERKIIIYACDQKENRIFTINPLVLDNKNVRKTFNYVKAYFENKLPPIEVIMNEKRILQVTNPININKAILFISDRERKLPIKEIQPKKQIDKEKKYSNFTVAYNAGESLSLTELKRYKSQYLNFLASNQQKNKRLVPSVEVKSYDNQYKEEDAFIFSIKTKYKDIIIYENVNPKHSTIVFSIESKFYMEALKNIYNFFDSGILNKRSKIRSRIIKFPQENIKYYYTVNHGSFFEWKWKIFNE